MSIRVGDSDAAETLCLYTGHFCPEFEYEEWAIAWRSRVHALFLELANRSIDGRVRVGDLEGARDIALLGLERDPKAEEIERKLIWLYWHLGSQSAAAAQYEHFSAAERADGVEPTPFATVVEADEVAG